MAGLMQLSAIWHWIGEQWSQLIDLSSSRSSHQGWVPPFARSDRWLLVVSVVSCILLSTLFLLVGKIRRDDESVKHSIRMMRPGGRRVTDSKFETNHRPNGSPDDVRLDLPLLQKHSQIRSYTLPARQITYPRIRTFYRPHPQADKLPVTPSPLPLLVVIHGLGGSLAQFHPLLTSLVHLAPCLGIDLPGCGLSDVAPLSWEAYTTEALVELLAVVIDQHRDRAAGQEVVLIGHSMGCSLAALLASPTSPHPSKLPNSTAGLLCICPKSTGPSASESRMLKQLVQLPDFVWDIWRAWDRRGGLNSPSIIRFVGPHADQETRRLQARFNAQSKTPVLRRMLWGLIPSYDDSTGSYLGGYPGKDVWSGVDTPVLLIGGEEDLVTKAVEVERVAALVGNSKASENATEGDRPDGIPRHVIPYIQKTIVPSPASHGLLYVPSTARIVAGLLSDFMASHISSRLSLGWQLQYLSTEGKWDVKNLKKWQAVTPVSEPIAGIFLVMKTLRQVDDRHRPEVFVQEWGSRVTDVIDISHESPSYDPRGLEKGGVKYHKLATVSKIPPTAEEVKEFLGLVDRLRLERQPSGNTGECPLIAVHCHYGSNRSGYFIVCYLVERRGYELQAAIDEFARCRPPGIKHDHFIDSLYVRYALGYSR